LESLPTATLPRPVTDATDIRAALKDKQDQQVTVLLESVSDSTRADGTREMIVTPRLSEEDHATIGVYLGETAVIYYEGIWGRLLAGPMHSYNVLSYSINGMKNIFAFSFETRSIEPVTHSVSGPVGIFKVVDGILDLGGGRAVLVLLDFAGLMSLSLAFINALPFPALDGGRLAFILIEVIFKRRVSPKIEAFMHSLGMVLLLSLIVLISIKDLLI
jgi:RIP metalloprotease RseP